MDWSTCKIKRLVKEIVRDDNLITSLINTSQKKLKSQKLLELNDDTASSKITLVYDALRELLEALAISNNYKIYNHECYTAFLKEILQESLLGDKFNDFRKIRNAINYYGKDLTKEEAKPLISEMLEFLEIVQKKLS